MDCFPIILLPLMGALYEFCTSHKHRWIHKLHHQKQSEVFEIFGIYIITNVHSGSNSSEVTGMWTYNIYNIQDMFLNTNENQSTLLLFIIYCTYFPNFLKIHPQHLQIIIRLSVNRITSKQERKRYLCKVMVKMTSGQSICHKTTSPPHINNSTVFARWRQCAPLSNR